MNASVRRFARKIIDFGSGEVVGRLASVATLLFLAHKFGVIFVGVYALAQGLVQYSYPFIDFGLRHVGARMMAKYPEAGEEIAHEVQRRRLRMAALLLPVLLVYAASVKLPLSSKLFLFVFSAVGSLYALSLDWAAWGREHLRLSSFGRAVVPISVLLAVLLGRNSDYVLWWLVGGNLVGSLIQAAIFRFWWARHKPEQTCQISLDVIRDALAWRRTSVMGVAWFCNMAFNSIDMLMLGILANPREVGLYSAAYRVLNQVLYTYYFMTAVLYPQLARQNQNQRLRMLRPRILITLVGLGVVIAICSDDCAASRNVRSIRTRFPPGDAVADAVGLGNTSRLSDVVFDDRLHRVGYGEEDSDVHRHRGWQQRYTESHLDSDLRSEGRRGQHANLLPHSAGDFGSGGTLGKGAFSRA